MRFAIVLEGNFVPWTFSIKLWPWPPIVFGRLKVELHLQKESCPIHLENFPPFGPNELFSMQSTIAHLYAPQMVSNYSSNFQ